MIRVFSQYVSPKSILLVALETVLMVFSLLCAVKLLWNDLVEFHSYTDQPYFAIQAAIVVITYQMCFYLNDLYDPQPTERRDDQALRLGQSLGAASLLLGFLYCIVPSLLVGRGVLFLNLVLVIGLILISRTALDRLWVATPTQRVLILGSGALASTVAREIAARQDLRLNLVGFVHENAVPAGATPTLFGRPILGGAAELESVVLNNRVSRIVVAMEDRRGALPTTGLVKLRVRGVLVEDAHSAVAALTGRVWLSTVRPSWFVFSSGFRRSYVTTLLKRSLDICFGMLGFLMSLPIMAAVAVAVRLDSKGPVLYRQERVGWKFRSFEVLKFRSMRQDAECGNGAQWAALDDPRVTRIGRYLRKFRLDELPQFWNVIRGDMSFVGPRPERPVFVAELRNQIPYYDERHSVRPGLTGWAQVQYPYGSTVEDAYRKLEYDLFYLKNMSVFFDFAIIFQTVRIVLTGKLGR